MSLIAILFVVIIGIILYTNDTLYTTPLSPAEKATNTLGCFAVIMMLSCVFFLGIWLIKIKQNEE